MATVAAKKGTRIRCRSGYERLSLAAAPSFKFGRKPSSDKSGLRASPSLLDRQCVFAATPRPEIAVATKMPNKSIFSEGSIDGFSAARDRKDAPLSQESRDPRA
ncbi:MAG: hypothetical protein WBS22_07980 [Methylocystis sp.]